MKATAKTKICCANKSTERKEKMRIRRFSDCIRVSKSLGGTVSPWEVACSRFEKKESALCENIRWEGEIYEQIKDVLSRAETLAQKKRLYDELYPLRGKIGIRLVHDAIVEQLERELQMASTQKEKKKLLKYALTTDAKLRIFERLFQHATSHDERMEVIKKSPRGFEPWFSFVWKTLERAETQAERWQLVQATADHGISSQIFAEIERQCQRNLAAAKTQTERWGVYQEAPKGSDIRMEALHLYLKRK